MRLAAGCGGAMSLETVNKSRVSIDVVRLRKAGSKPTNRVFMLLGEHSRELISSESGLYLLRALCGDVQLSEGAPSADDVLEDSEFKIILNSNPRSRPKVENGEYCLRTNPSGVDLNRNWDEEFEAQEQELGSEEYGGPQAFSEPETQIFRSLLAEYRPTTFLSVHSGTLGMYMPWAFDTNDLAERNGPQMLQVLKALDQTYCKCPFGAAGKEVGYSSSGTSLDWVYDKLQSPYAFAMEIYASPANLHSLTDRWNTKVESGGEVLLAKGQHLGHPHFMDLFRAHVSDFVQTKNHQETLQQEQADSCFKMFNPDTKELYERTVANWAAAFMEMSQRVAGNLRGVQASAAAP